MKTTWAIAAALLLVAAAAMDTAAKKGWGGKRGFHGHGKRTSLVEQLGLSEDQQAQLENLKDALHEQRQALGEQYRTDFEAILTDEQRATLQERKNPLGLSEDQQTQIQALKDQDLSKEEFHTSLEAILTDEQRTTLQERKGQRGQRKDSLVEQLDLTEDQQTQLAALKEDLQESWQALREEFSTDFEAMLTAEQLAMLEEHKAERGCHAKDRAEKTETEAAGKATSAVEATSWGHVKESFGP